jgi:hypothetical protein
VPPRRPGGTGPRPTSTLVGAPNVHSPNGRSSNGHASNGHAPNGHAPNGDAPDGGAASPGLWGVVPLEPGPPVRQPLAVRLQSWGLLALALLACIGAVLLEAQRDTPPDLHIGPGPATTAPSPEGGQTADAERAFGYINPPPQAPPVGSYVRANVLPDGAVEVHEWVTSASVLDRVVLAPRLQDGAAVWATDLQMAADLFTVTEGGTVGDRGRMFPLHAPAYRLHLAYVLRNPVAAGSGGGQDEVLPTALDVRFAGRSGPARVDVVGPNVVSVACAAGPGAASRPCGDKTGDGWTVEQGNPDAWVTARIRVR